MVSCVICKEREAVLRHHIRYNPPRVIEICKECHRDLHHELRGPMRIISAKLPIGLVEEVDTYARTTGNFYSRSDLIRTAIRELIERKNTEPIQAKPPPQGERIGIQ